MGNEFRIVTTISLKWLHLIFKWDTLTVHGEKEDSEMQQYTRKSSWKSKTLRHEKAALLFAKINGRSTVDFHSMKKGLASKRGISTEWMFKKIKNSKKKSAFWTRREAFHDFLEHVQ